MCQCQNGFNGTLCEVPINCAAGGSFTCINGGICNGGICSCVNAYNGNTCSECKRIF